MKILLILQLFPPIHGASTTGEIILKSKLINASFDCTYQRISTVPKAGKNPLLKVLNLHLLYFKVIKSFILHKYDLVYITPCTSGFFPFYKDFGLCIISKLFCKKVLYHFHDKGISTNKYVPPLLFKAYFHKVKVILSSNLLYYDIRKFVQQEDVYICPYGIPDEPKNNPYSLKNKVPVILFIAHMIKSKGVFDLLEACKILKGRGVNFKCNFVGSWHDVNEIDFLNFIKNNDLAKEVFFLGPQYGNEKNRRLNESDIFCLPTFYPLECFPLVILDAMRQGIPVVSTNEGAITEIVMHNSTGYIINKNDPESLSNALQELIKNAGLRETFGKNGRQEFEKKYTLEIFEKKITAIIQNFLSLTV